jgi:DNA-binding response OmpR family regulator
LTEVRARRGAQAGAEVAILADDLIWSTRLADAVGAAGGVPRRVRRLRDLEALLGDGRSPFVIVDLTALGYDGVEAIRSAAATGARVVAVGQHDDVATRKAALAAGAERVYAYRKLFEDGPRTLGAWLAR